MDAKEELKKLKKLYGEKFAHLCRELFPTILDMPGELLQILQSKFATNSRTLYDDIQSNFVEEEFKNFIFQQFDLENKQIIKDEEIRTPYQLMEEAGYTLVECNSEEDIKSFKKYYEPKEALCTFRGGRLQRCIVFWAVKNGAEDLKREDFKNPRREDEYGTSVMSIQFSRRAESTVSIKNRYNHTVNNPDATFGNDLDKIIPGLEQSFNQLLQERGMSLNYKNKEKFQMPKYVVANDGKYYKYNMEMNGIYYCPGNVVIDNGTVMELGNQEKEILMDYFVLDLKKKEIRVYDDSEDSFIDGLQNIEKIDVKRNKENDTKIITVTQKGEAPITIELNRDNQIIGYVNTNLEQARSNFLHSNKCLANLELVNLKKVGDKFLYRNQELTQLKLPSLEQVGDDFLWSNEKLTQLKLPMLKQAGNKFLCYNRALTQLELLNLEQAENYFLANNEGLTHLKLPVLKKVKDNFLYRNENITQIELPNLEQVGDCFLYNNGGLIRLELPSLEQAGDSFLYTNEELTQLILPKLERIGNSFLCYNTGLEQLELLNLEQVGDYFLAKNQKLEKLKMPKLKEIGKVFLGSNQGLTQIEFPRLKQVNDRFIYSNQGLAHVELPNLEQVGDCFLDYNQGLKQLKLPKLKQIGSRFLHYNKELMKLELPNLRQIEDGFLHHNQSITQLELPSAERTENTFLSSRILALLDKKTQLTETEVNENPLVGLKQALQEKER